MKKIPTLFVRDYSGARPVLTDVVTPGCEWVIAGEGIATRKYDGTCVAVINDGGSYSMWTRREVKPGKTAPPGFEVVELDDQTGKTVGWEPWSSSSFAKYLAEARENWATAHPLPSVWHSDLPTGTYELVGPKINGNPENYPEHCLVRHADAETFGASGRPRAFDDLQRMVLALSKQGWEGVVWHHKDGRMAKLKGKDFR